MDITSAKAIAEALTSFYLSNPSEMYKDYPSMCKTQTLKRTSQAKTLFATIYNEIIENN